LVPRLVKKIPRPPPPVLKDRFSKHYQWKCRQRLFAFKKQVESAYARDPKLRSHHEQLHQQLVAEFQMRGGPTMGPPMSPRHAFWILSLPPEHAAEAFMCRLWFQRAESVPWKPLGAR